MTIAGNVRTFLDKFKFTIHIDGFAHAGFNKMSELSAEFDEIVYREGGDLVPTVKDPGLMNVGDVTLERGAVASDGDLYEWFEEVANFSTNTGKVQPVFKRQFDIVERDREGNPVQRWRCEEAWPKKFVAGEWDADASEKVIQKVTLSIRGFKRRVNLG